MTQDSAGWIEWTGGKRPTAWNARIDVRVRSGQQINNCLAAMERWTHAGSPSDIVAYRAFRVDRVVEQVAPPLPEDEITLDQKFDRFTQQFAQAVVRLDGRFDKLSAQIAAAVEATEVKIRNTVVIEPVDGPKRFHAGGFVGSLVARETNHLFGERPSPHIIPIKVRKRDFENESAPEIRPVEKAEVQSDHARATQSEVDPDGAFERAFAETFGRCLSNESEPEPTLESKAETASDLALSAKEIALREAAIVVQMAKFAPPDDVARWVVEAYLAALSDSGGTKTETQSNLDEPRARHILKLWDAAQYITLDGIGYRTHGTDHVPRPRQFETMSMDAPSAPPPSPRKV